MSEAEWRREMSKLQSKALGFKVEAQTWRWTQGNTSRDLVRSLGVLYLVKRVSEQYTVYYDVERPDILGDGTLCFLSQGSSDIGYRKVVAFIKIDDREWAYMEKV